MFNVLIDMAKASWMNNSIAALAFILSLISFLFTMFAARRASSAAEKATKKAGEEAVARELRIEDRFREEMIQAAAASGEDRRQQQDHFARNQDRELSLRTASVYLSLEVNSSAIFQHTAAQAELMANYRCKAIPEGFDWQSKDNIQARETTLNLFFQSLNLFEVAARMRRERLFPDEVYASWVAWFVEILESWYFRHEWSSIRNNYTDDVRAIFDVGTDLISQGHEDEAFEQRFYAAVGHIIEGSTPPKLVSIAEWPARMKRKTRWTNGQVNLFYSRGTILQPSPQTPPPLPLA